MFLRVPLIRDVVQFAVIERFCRIIAAMVQGGRAAARRRWHAAIEGANNKVFEAGLTTARERMLEGEGLAGPIADTGCSRERRAR